MTESVWTNNENNRATSTFFSLGQVLPTHRLWHSPYGGLYQPTMTQAIKLLSGPPPSPWSAASDSALAAAPPSTSAPPIPKPLFFSTNSVDQFSAPSAYSTYRNAWVHVFPEACCHQSPDSGMRYFKWGVSRLILESDPAPEFIPMFVHGTQHIMAEDRGWPRFLPRMGNRVRVVIGEPTNVDQVFGHQRAAWRKLVEKGDPDLLRDSPEAAELRISVAKRVRDEVEKLRETLGFPAEQDEKPALAETWAKEPHETKFKSPVDGSFVNRHGPKK
ncbi:hypothetical protein F66182_8217 [Fusarium sp. NRRL 66182]|nr:hypothetical protein F66182_8217 [Fusarium sp. NRRL 66182]